MFSSIRLRRRQQCCKPKIGVETLVTTKLSSESSKDQIQYMTMMIRSLEPRDLQQEPWLGEYKRNGP